MYALYDSKPEYSGQLQSQSGPLRSELSVTPLFSDNNFRTHISQLRRTVHIDIQK